MKWIRLYARLLWHYARFFLAARTRYDVHSPFLYQFLEEVLEDDRYYYAFGENEMLRRRLLNDRGRLQIDDFGAGSKANPARERSIRDVARHSAVSSAAGRFLFRLVQFVKPSRMLELGTSLGISAAYQAAAARRARFLTIEGCPSIAEAARENLDRFGYSKVEISTGKFTEKLPEALEKLEQLDYLYLDGDHRRGASLQYFEQCLKYAHPESVFVIADIYWSEEMREAWQQMKAHPAVRLSVDVFHFGLLFFRREQLEPSHIKLIKARYKPWRLGIFN